MSNVRETDRQTLAHCKLIFLNKLWRKIPGSSLMHDALIELDITKLPIKMEITSQYGEGVFEGPSCIHFMPNVRFSLNMYHLSAIDYSLCGTEH
jgi:hypothetical protein